MYQILSVKMPCSSEHQETGETEKTYIYSLLHFALEAYVVIIMLFHLQCRIKFCCFVCFLICTYTYSVYLN